MAQLKRNALVIFSVFNQTNSLFSVLPLYFLEIYLLQPSYARRHILKQYALILDKLKNKIENA